MSEMIEDVAYAIAEKVAETNFVGTVNQGGLTADDMQAFFTAFARAAIAAMREPTDLMTDAGGEAAHTHPTMCVPVYCAMIDAALNER